MYDQSLRVKMSIFHSLYVGDACMNRINFLYLRDCECGYEMLE